MQKTNDGNFFEDFELGQVLTHALPITIDEGRRAFYASFFGTRFALFSSDAFAQRCGLPRAPIDPLLVFHNVFGQTVPDISLNARANLGYAECRFLQPVYPGDSLTSTSEVLGLKENSSGKTGVVYVRTTGLNQRGEPVLSYVRWVMVKKRSESSPAPAEERVPELADAVAADDLVLPEGLDLSGYDFALAGSPFTYEDYEVGEKIDHVTGRVVDDLTGAVMTLAFNNDAKVHFPVEPGARPLVYGGIVISTAKSLSFNGLQNAGLVLGINAGRHVNPYSGQEAIHVWTEVLDRADIGGAGALRLRMVAVKGTGDASGFPDKGEDGKYPPEVILDLDYWAAVPKRS